MVQSLRTCYGSLLHAPLRTVHKTTVMHACVPLRVCVFLCAACVYVRPLIHMLLITICMQGDPFRTLFVSRLSYDVTDKKLRREFEEYGPIKRARIVTDKNGEGFDQSGTLVRGGDSVHASMKACVCMCLYHECVHVWMHPVLLLCDMQGMPEYVSQHSPVNTLLDVKMRG